MKLPQKIDTNFAYAIIMLISSIIAFGVWNAVAQDEIDEMYAQVEREAMSIAHRRHVEALGSNRFLQFDEDLSAEIETYNGVQSIIVSKNGGKFALTFDDEILQGDNVRFTLVNFSRTGRYLVYVNHREQSYAGGAYVHDLAEDQFIRFPLFDPKIEFTIDDSHALTCEGTGLGSGHVTLVSLPDGTQTKIMDEGREAQGTEYLAVDSCAYDAATNAVNYTTYIFHDGPMIENVYQIN